MESYTASMSYGKTAINHSLRNKKYVEKQQQLNRLDNINKELTKNNIILKNCNSLENEFNELFEDVKQQHNQKQRNSNHPERQIDNYFQYIKNQKQGKNPMKTNYEYVIQFGSKDKIPPNSVEMLKNVYNKLKELDHNFHINYAAIHLDETSPHLHINITPIARGYKRGMSMRPALNKATSQCFNTNREYGYKNLLDYVKDGVMTHELEQNGFKREIKAEEKAHSNVEEYKTKEKLKEENKKLENENKYLEEVLDEKKVRLLELTSKSQNLKMKVQYPNYEKVLQKKNKKQFLQNNIQLYELNEQLSTLRRQLLMSRKYNKHYLKTSLINMEELENMSE